MCSHSYKATFNSLRFRVRWKDQSCSQGFQWKWLNWKVRINLKFRKFRSLILDKIRQLRRIKSSRKLQHNLNPLLRLSIQINWSIYCRIRQILVKFMQTISKLQMKGKIKEVIKRILVLKSNLSIWTKNQSQVVGCQK